MREWLSVVISLAANYVVRRDDVFRRSIIAYDGLPVSQGGAHRLRTPDLSRTHKGVSPGGTAMMRM